MTVSLRPVEASDFELIKSWAEDKQHREFFRRFAPAWSWQAAQFLSQFPPETCFIICEDSEPIGLCGFFNFEPLAKKAEYGILVAKLERRRHVNLAACKQAFDYFFNYLGYNKVYCLLFPHRQELLSFMGTWRFKCEGVLRDNVYIAGRYYDEVIYGLIAEDYRKLDLTRGAETKEAS